MAKRALGVLGCVGERAEIEIRQVNVREVNDDVESLQSAYIAMQMRNARLGDGPKSCGIGGREPPQIHRERVAVARSHPKERLIIKRSKHVHPMQLGVVNW